MKKILKIGLITLISTISLNAYDIEKNGDWWYMYNGNDVVGAYKKLSYGNKYRVGCDSPEKMQYNKKYKETNTYKMSQNYNTKREAQSVIKRYCKKR